MTVYEDLGGINLPDLEDEYYIYVLENDNYVKIGRTSHVGQRIRALSGSNCGGCPPKRIAVSEPTYLYSIETVSHTHFDYARIQGTEWFDISFDEAKSYVESLFTSRGYPKYNEIRKTFISERGFKNDIIHRMPVS